MGSLGWRQGLDAGIIEDSWLLGEKPKDRGRKTCEVNFHSRPMPPSALRSSSAVTNSPVLVPLPRLGWSCMEIPGEKN